MAGARGRLHKTPGTAGSRRSARTGRGSSQKDDVPAVFQELLDEVEDNDHPRKKQKIAPVEPHTLPVQNSAARTTKAASPLPIKSLSAPAIQSPSRIHALATTTAVASDDEAQPHDRIRQTIVDSDKSDDSDMEWEDALDDGNDTEDDDAPQAAPVIGDISITFGGQKSENVPPRRVRRRAITSVDKKRRLDIHKMHIMCLLCHVHRRNVWCNDRRVQSALRKLVPGSVLQLLVPNPELTQFSASKRFIDAMNQIKLLWSKRFQITAQGMYKPRWAEADAPARPLSDFDDLDDPMDKDDFRTAAQTLRGSQDVGAQLLCALLRGIGIDARLVFSLQPLPFLSAAERATPLKTSVQKKTIEIDPFNKAPQTSPSRPATTRPKGKKLSRLERMMGERHVVLHNTGVAPKKQKAFHVPYPVYWVETFNTVQQKWVPIDPHSTFSVNMPDKLEPPLSYTQNSLTYVVALEEDYTARDVTRRYAKAYNAKTRKFRVESTSGGNKWWERTMKFFHGSAVLDREQVEDAALTRKEAAEGIPKNVQDFKGHPVYVLERHLKQNEVIHPLTQVGKVNCGTAMNPKMEPIYRRNNVHVVRSSDKWYRMGRDIKAGEQPLKHAKPKINRRASVGIDGEAHEQEDAAGAALYAEYQTELYVPPPVIRGRVPRNVYGNLDLYVPSMCPAGGVHIRHKLAAKAARIVGVDFADAVTGFSFKGRHGTAVVQGVVVAKEYADAVQAAIDGLEYQVEEAEENARRVQSLQLWRRFFLGLRIAQRVNAIEIDGEKGPDISMEDEISKQERELHAHNMAGGFFPDEGTTEEHQPQGYQPSQHQQPYVPMEEDIADEEEEASIEADANADEPPRPLPINLDRAWSFESAILDSQELRPRRKSSIGEVYSSEDDTAHSLREESPTTQRALLDALARQREDEDEFGGGFIPDEPEDEEMEEDNEKATIEVEPSTENGDSGEPLGTSVVETKFIPVSAPVQATPASSPSDAGSLPLEDPDDEDADPDWLVDAT